MLLQLLLLLAIQLVVLLVENFTTVRTLMMVGRLGITLVQEQLRVLLVLGLERVAVAVAQILVVETELTAVQG
jgi:hypothetical protein